MAGSLTKLSLVLTVSMKRSPLFLQSNTYIQRPMTCCQVYIRFDGILKVSPLLGTGLSSRKLTYGYSTQNSTSKPTATTIPRSIPSFQLDLFIRIHLHRRPKPSKTLHYLYPRVCFCRRLPRCPTRPLCRSFNDRQTKNAVRNARALDFNEKKSLAIHYMLKMLEAAEAFQRDLKGRTGYLDAIGSYT